MGRNAKIVLGITASIVFVVASWNLLKSFELSKRQTMIHERGMQVMPFDLNATLHTFKKNDHGGVQTVIVRDPADDKNLSLIRTHLRMEASRFSQGDFGDPAILHGEYMPGVSVFEDNYAKMNVRYDEISSGAMITYESTDSQTISAIHNWFDAQVTDHGKDASQ